MYYNGGMGSVHPKEWRWHYLGGACKLMPTPFYVID